MTYRVLPGPTATRAQRALARRYSDLDEALANMGRGIVIADDDRLVAFHERHLGWIERGGRHCA